MKRNACLMSLAMVFLLTTVSLGETRKGLPDKISDPSRKCIVCHQKVRDASGIPGTPGLVRQWQNSLHYQMNVGCYECHSAVEGEPDAFLHHGEYVSTIASPKDCSKCHETKTAEFSRSSHANAACLVTKCELGSYCIEHVLNLSGRYKFTTPEHPGGVSAAGGNGCWKCHGAEVKANKDGRLDAATWPNTGMGRINPDGSRGNCAACHAGIRFPPHRRDSRKAARCVIPRIPTRSYTKSTRARGTASTMQPKRMQ